MNWNLWSRQIDAIVRLELKSYVLGKRFGAMCLMAYAPVFLMLLVALRGREQSGVETMADDYATFFQIFFLRFVIVISCGVFFSQLFRGAMLEKTLHFHLLTPAKRSIIAAGKYVAGIVVTVFVFGTSTTATYFLMFWRNPAFSSFLFQGGGLVNLARYLTAIILACMAYGSIFMLLGLLFKNPGGPIVLVLGWEGFNSFLPSTLQKVSVVHYLQPILPIQIDRGPFAVITDPTPLVLSIPGLMIATGVFIAIAGWIVSRTEVTYSAE